MPDISLLSQEDSQDTENEPIEEEKEVASEMAPLYLFLASSLNVELVYIILTSISKFSHLINDGQSASA